MSTAPRMLIDWPAFLTDPQVKDMPPLTRGIYLLLLGAMWMNEAWLRDDDANIARKLDMDVRTWRSHRPHIDPAIEHKSDPFLGPILQQKRLSREYAIALDLIAKRKAQTAPARARKAGKPPSRPSVTERPNGRHTETAATPVTDQATVTETGGNTPSHKDRTLPIKKAESSILPSPQALGALPPMPSGEVSAPSDPALVKRLVSDGLKRTGTSIFDRLNAAKEDDDGRS